MRHETLTMGVLMFASVVAPAEEQSAKDRLQRSLNQEVMAAPFNPGDVRKARLEAEALKQMNVVPVAHPPSYWLPGWTCANLTTYRHYAYTAYRDCIYHYHYHGRYWR